MGAGPSTTSSSSATFAPPSPSASISLMSVYWPFPLRIDAVQYDACFQIGEFPSDHVDTSKGASSIVVLVPLKSGDNPGTAGTFINKVVSQIPNIMPPIAKPDINLGFADVPAQTGAGWGLANILQADRPFYTWVNSDGTRVIVMAEPAIITSTDLSNIKGLPITPPEDVIHEIGSYVYYRSAPPIDCAGNPILCRSPFNIIQPQQYLPENSVSGGKRDVIMSGVGILWSFFLACFAAWIAIMLATGTGAKIISGISGGISKIIGAVRGSKPAAPAPAKPAAPAPNEPPVNPMFKPKPRSEPSA